MKNTEPISFGLSIDGGYYCKINDGRYMDELRHNLAGILRGKRKRNGSRLKAIRRLPNGWEEEQSLTVSGNGF